MSSIFKDFFGNPPTEVIGLKIFKHAALFTLGGAAYVGLELLWRGRSHASMFLAGGGSFVLLGKLRTRALPLPARAAAGAGVITGVELVTGLLVNRDFHVWDYRQMPMQFLGQICVPYMLLWAPLSLGAMELYRLLDLKLDDPPERAVPGILEQGDVGRQECQHHKGHSYEA